ncbi:MAG: pyrroline-5-carboxylate reductase [Candidatus Margulisbacteria bacterium]|jgi:pyrroline-5-carboxylate reductase|nr:pyrroline-5-carboxylate reductase [Candidatus Margulisiibacteriota bacterium]
MKIAFLGGGRMAEALIASLGRSAKVIVADVDPKRLRLLKSKYKVTTTRSNAEAFASADVVVLAVKPQQVAEVLLGLRVVGSRGKKIVISIVAGIPIKYLQKKLPGCQIIRTMPNNPALVGQGITAIAGGTRDEGRGTKIAKKIFSSVGEVVVVPEKWLDAVTGLSGSGPAFVYLVMEALIEGGVAQGLPFAVAEQLAIQTVIGAAQTARASVHSLKELRQMVTSPGGTTIEGLAVLEKFKLVDALAGAVRAAARKAGVLSAQWGR